MKESKLFNIYLLIAFLLFFLFWLFAYFFTASKPIQTPISSEINFNNLYLLIPLIFLSYFILYKLLTKKKIRLLPLIFCAFLFLLLLNSSKKNISFYSSLNSANDYYPDALKIKKLYKFLVLYHENIYYYQLHTRTHPPGPVIFHFLINKMFPNQIIINGLLMVLLSSLTLYVLHKLSLVLKSPHPNILLLLLLSSPGFLLYGGTSMDAVFAFLISLSIYLILLLSKKRSLVLIILTGLSIFLSLFFTYAAVIILLFIAFFIIINQFKNKKFIISIIIVSLTVCSCYLILYLFSGFNPIYSLLASRNFNTMLMPNIFMTPKRYLFSVNANLIEYIIFLGLPIFSIFLITLTQIIRQKKYRERWIYYLAFLIPMILLNFAGIYKVGPWSGETGRIWLFLTPLIIAGLNINNKNLLIKVCFLSFIQTLIMQLTLNIFW